MPTGTESEKVVNLVGTKDNPAREPRKRPGTGKGSIGDKAFIDSVIVVAIAWLLLLFLMYSLRAHNI
jgi:hypothetical protein